MSLAKEHAKLSMYGISIEYPVNWGFGIDPKDPPSNLGGYFRLEDFVPKKGARISMGVNWQKQPSNNQSFAEKYRANLEKQYKKQFKKTHYEINALDEVDFLGNKAVYIESSYIGIKGLVKSKSDRPVKTMQLAYYDDPTQRAVVVSIVGEPDSIDLNYKTLRELMFSVRCEEPILTELPEIEEDEDMGDAEMNIEDKADTSADAEISAAEDTESDAETSADE